MIHCHKCGTPLTVTLIPVRRYDGKTGERLYKAHIQCEQNRLGGLLGAIFDGHTNEDFTDFLADSELVTRTLDEWEQELSKSGQPYTVKP